MMPYLLMVALFAVSALEDGLAALTEAFGDSNYLLGGVALAVIAALAVLKILKKDIPFVDPLARLLIGAARLIKFKKPAEAPKSDAPGLAAVVPLEQPKKDEEQK